LVNINKPGQKNRVKNNLFFSFINYGKFSGKNGIYVLFGPNLFLSVFHLLKKGSLCPFSRISMERENLKLASAAKTGHIQLQANDR
jgi:hypothetical protein